MSRAIWFRFVGGYDLLNDYEIYQLSGDVFKEKFIAAVHGEQNEFSKYISIRYQRPPIPNWSEIRSEIFARDDYTCAYCGERGSRLECDHIIPVSRGGSSEPDNLTTACRDCNREKRAKTPEEWLR